MAWDARGTKRYYYRTRRVNGRVVREYVGRGPAAEHEAELDVRLRAERRAARVGQRAAEASFLEAAGPAAELITLADLLTRGTLVAAGYHQHDRGNWRKRRRQP